MRKWILRWEILTGIAVFISSNSLGAGLQVTGWTNVPAGVSIMSVGTLVSMALIIYAWRKYKPSIGEEARPLGAVRCSARQQAQKLHARISELEQELWKAKEQVSKGQKPLDNTEIKRIFSEIKQERNKPENSNIGDYELDKKFDALEDLYIRFIEFDFNLYEPEILEFLNKAHTAIRWHINHKIKD